MEELRVEVRGMMDGGGVRRKDLTLVDVGNGGNRFGFNEEFNRLRLMG